MTTDITELAQRMKTAAEKLDADQWQTRKGFSGIEVIVKGSLEKGHGCVSFQPVAADMADTKTARAIALFSPANVLALVEALENSESRLHEVAVACATAEQALEKAQQQTTESENRVRKQNRHICELFDDNTALRQRIAELESRTVTAAAADVLAERQRQVTAEGWTAERDDSYQNSELADAAACYAIHAHNQGFSTPAHWPWSPTWWKQTNPRRDLVKAGALILAEIERIDRAAGIKWEAE
ncbi:hypothetical protein ACRJX6_000209 [Klebsiella pneumoniae]